jgi:hypothetical protein
MQHVAEFSISQTVSAGLSPQAPEVNIRPEISNTYLNLGYYLDGEKRYR